MLNYYVLNEYVYDYAIIGSGPSALAALRRIPDNLSVIVIDRGQVMPNEIKDAQEKLRKPEIAYSGVPLSFNKGSLKKSSFDLKLYWGSSFPYKISEASPPYESQSRGGFSNVWGATCFPASKRIFGELSSVNQALYLKQISEIEQVINVSWGRTNAPCYSACSTDNNFLNNRSSFASHLGTAGFFESPDISLYWEQTRLAVSPPNKQLGCVNCGLCQVGCPLGITWNSWHEFQKEISRVSGKYLVGDVLSVDDNERTASLRYLTNSNEHTVGAKRVLLTGGVLSTANILLNSGIISTATIHDSQTVGIFGFSPKKRLFYTEVSNVSFPEMSFLFQTKTNEFSIQVYSLNKAVLDRSMPYLARIASKSKFLSWCIQRFFFVGLAYFDSHMSGKLLVGMDGRRIYQGDKKKRKVLFKQARVRMRSVSLFLFPLCRNLKVGGGYHYMGNFFAAETWKNEDVLLRKGMVKLTSTAAITDSSRIHIVDGSIQGHLPTGSVTLNSMAMTSMIVDRIVQSDQSSNSN